MGLFCFFLLFVAPITQSILCRRIIKGKLNGVIDVVSACCFVLGVILSFMSTYIMMCYWAANGIKCMTGLVGIIPLGIIITIITTPIIAYRASKKYNKTHKPEIKFKIM